jgi:phosphohistidine phosphatase
MKLWILRHAKAEAHSDTGRDRDRALAPAGERACRKLNHWLKAARLAWPELILVSPAMRTRQTADLALDGLGTGEARICEDLWLASAREMAGLIEAQGRAGIDSLMLVGHNPGSRLVQLADHQLPAWA